jgi:hypothetical protein
MDHAASRILAYVSESDAYDHVLRAATDAARQGGAELILYDGESGSAISEPLPNEWSAAGEADQFGSRLDAEQLVQLGRERMAAKLTDVVASGITAWAWLANSHGLEEFMDYGAFQGADLVMVPAELADAGVVDKLRGQTLADAVDTRTAPIVVVDKKGGTADI